LTDQRFGTFLSDFGFSRHGHVLSGFYWTSRAALRMNEATAYD
jgi:hypothetical protein